MEVFSEAVLQPSDPRLDKPLLVYSEWGHRDDNQAAVSPGCVPHQEHGETMITAAWVAHIRERLRHDYDEVIMIEGYEGSGKSALAWWLAKAIDPDGFSHERMVMSGADFIKKASGLSPGSAIVWDETIEGGFSRRAMSQENVDTAKWMTISRARCLCSIIVMPDMHWVDVILREHRIRWRLVIDRRGYVSVKAPGGRHMDGSRSWQTVHRFRYPKPVGADWETYYRAKLEMIEESVKPKKKSKKSKKSEES